MVLKYNIEIDNDAVCDDLDRIINQVFKLLPFREEGGDWETPLHNLILEVGGMSKMLKCDQTILFSLLCKMEALTTLTNPEDYLAFRKLIFECLGLLKQLKSCLV